MPALGAAAQAAAAPTRLFFGNLNARVTATELAHRLEPFGTVAEVTLVPCKALGGGLESGQVNAFFTLTPRKDTADITSCISTFNGCTWLGTRLRVGRATEDFLQRLERERLAEERASAAAVAAAEERRLLAAAAPVDSAELERQWQHATLRLRGPGGQWMSVCACGGPGSHKRSFQRLQPTAAAPAETQAVAPQVTTAAQKPSAAATDDKDPWAKLFRRVAHLDDVDEQPDDVPDVSDPDMDADAEELPPAVQESPPRSSRAAPASKPIPHIKDADAAQQKRKQLDIPTSRERPALTEAAYTTQANDDAVAIERAQQLALLSRLGLAGRVDDDAQEGMAPAAQTVRPVAPGFSSSSDEEAPVEVEDKAFVEQPTERALRGAAAKKRSSARAAAQPPMVVADASAWDRALRMAAGEDVDDGKLNPTASVEARPPSPPPSASVEEEQPRKRRRGRKQHTDEGTAVPAPPDPKAEARAARVRQALDATRLGEGRTGVYYADHAFDWRSLAVDAGQQTWSLLGNTTAEVEPHQAETHVIVPLQGDQPMLPPAAPPAPAQALKPVDLAALGARFTRQADTAADAKAAWQANRDFLWDDAKRKRRDVKRKLRK